jgi:CSLREA domain-containing protein
MSVSSRVVFACALVAAGGFGSAIAATFTPTRTDDPAPNGCQKFDCSLREAVIAANATPASDTIVLDAARYALTRTTGTEAESYDLDTSTPITITGATGGTVIASDHTTVNKQSRIFDVSASSLSLNRVKLESATVLGRGGCLRVKAAYVSIAEGGMNNCEAEFGAGASVVDGMLSLVDGDARNNIGGAVSLTDSDLHLQFFYMRFNQADRGGAIYVDGASSSIVASAGVDDSRIQFNDARLGAGIYVAAGTALEVSGAPGQALVFNANHAAERGGGIYAASGTLVLDRVTFVSNTAVFDGGGVHAHNVDINYGLFTHNRADNGAGLFANCDVDGATCRVNGTEFAENVGYVTGGAIHGSGTERLDIDNVDSYANYAPLGADFHLTSSARLRHVTTLVPSYGTWLNASVSTAGTVAQPVTLAVSNSALMRGCALGAETTLINHGANAQYADSAPCGFTRSDDMPALTVADAPFERVFETGRWYLSVPVASSVLLGAGRSGWCLSRDVRAFNRPQPCDIGAYESDGFAP